MSSSTIRNGLFVLVAGLTVGCSREPSQLQRVRETGELRAVVRVVPPRTPRSPVDLERTLVEAFGRWLGVKVRFIEASNPLEGYWKLASGQADLGALGAPPPPVERVPLTRGPVLRRIDEHVVYRRRRKRPRAPGDLRRSKVRIPIGSPIKFDFQHGDRYDVTEDVQRDAPALLAAVWRKKIRHTAVTSEYLAAFQPLYPELRSAFMLRGRLPVAWVFPVADPSLRTAAVYFVNAMRRSGELQRLSYSHLADPETFDYVATRRLIRRIRKRLPPFAPLFRAAGKRHRLDWRLLASIGYRESYWNPQAVSPTGVKGMMMLTARTARALGVDRTDPAESIDGAGRYFARLRRRLPDAIPAGERDWFALVAYTLGYTHLEDARILTRMTGGDPNRWVDVRRRLPWLRESRWYTHLPAGKAPGDRALEYVRAVRRCYDQLRWRHPT